MRIAVVGATGNVGREMFKVLAERDVPVDEIFAVASARSAGSTVLFKNQEVVVEDLATFDFSKANIALFSAGGDMSKEYAPKAAGAGCVVIDNSSAWRMDPDVPLIVPEVNPDAVGGYSAKNIIANPNCSTIQMVVALQPLHEAAGIKRVVVATYQATSGAGKAGMDALQNEAEKWVKSEVVQASHFPKQIAVNCVPQIDVFREDGFTKEEWKMMVETDKIMGISANVTATCVRVPVVNSHAESVTVEFEKPISVQEAWMALNKAPGVKVVDEWQPGGYQTQVDADGSDDVFVSRMRTDKTVPHGLTFWCVSDNLRKGAATNTVQIAELLIPYLSK